MIFVNPTNIYVMNRIFDLLLFILVIFAGFNCTNKVLGNGDFDSKPVSHSIWNELTQKYVAENGDVNYKGFVKDSTRLNEYLKILENNHPNDKHWSKDEQLAYWINAYNAFTVKLIVKNYPVKSIKDLGGGIYKVNTTWDIKFIHIGDETYDLNNIEHGIIRKEFNEPRIHFAVNCASVSCPKLRNEAFVASKLDSQLTDQAKDFINNPTKNKISPNEAQLSKLFSWFKSDFTENMSLIEFINQYSNTKLNKDTDLDYLDYSWELNEKK